MWSPEGTIAPPPQGIFLPPLTPPQEEFEEPRAAVRATLAASSSSSQNCAAADSGGGGGATTRAKQTDDRGLFAVAIATELAAEGVLPRFCCCFFSHGLTTLLRLFPSTLPALRLLPLEAPPLLPPLTLLLLLLMMKRVAVAFAASLASPPPRVFDSDLALGSCVVTGRAGKSSAKSSPSTSSAYKPTLVEQPLVFFPLFEVTWKSPPQPPALLLLLVLLPVRRLTSVKVSTNGIQSSATRICPANPWAALDILSFRIR